MQNKRSPKSKEGCRATKRQIQWLWQVMKLKPSVKTYCMIKRLVLYATNKKNYIVIGEGNTIQAAYADYQKKHRLL